MDNVGVDPLDNTDLNAVLYDLHKQPGDDLQQS